MFLDYILVADKYLRKKRKTDMNFITKTKVFSQLSLLKLNGLVKKKVDFFHLRQYMKKASSSLFYCSYILGAEVADFLSLSISIVHANFTFMMTRGF